MNTNNFSVLPPNNKTAAEKKKSLRARMKRRRADNENRDLKERALIDRFFESGAGERESYFVYLSFSSEAPTDKLIERLLCLGKRVYCPRADGEDADGAGMCAVPFGEDFTLSDRGIREPVGEAYRGTIDVVVLPLLAVDKTGTRLGYGGGYYDRFLKLHSETLPVAWCYDFQVTENVPKEAWDIPAKLIVTDRRIIKTDETDENTNE